MSKKKKRNVFEPIPRERALVPYEPPITLPVPLDKDMEGTEAPPAKKKESGSGCFRMF